MGAWAYCRTCDSGLDKPTLREILDDCQMCNNGHANEPVGSKNEALLEIEERIASLENFLKDFGYVQ
jgi:hypothetical protein